MNTLITIFSSAAWTDAVFALLHSIWLGGLWVGLLAPGSEVRWQQSRN